MRPHADADGTVCEPGTPEEDLRAIGDGLGVDIRLRRADDGAAQTTGPERCAGLRSPQPPARSADRGDGRLISSATGFSLET